MNFNIRKVTDFISEKKTQKPQEQRAIESIVAESERRISETEKIRKQIAEELSTHGSYIDGSIPFPEKVKTIIEQSPLGRETSPCVGDDSINSNTTEVDFNNESSSKFGKMPGNKTKAKTPISDKKHTVI